LILRGKLGNALTRISSHLPSTTTQARQRVEIYVQCKGEFDDSGGGGDMGSAGDRGSAGSASSGGAGGGGDMGSAGDSEWGAEA
jgi:hypothetical protein